MSHAPVARAHSACTPPRTPPLAALNSDSTMAAGHPPPVLTSAGKSRASCSNPLETLLKDLKCCICLSIARAPVSLPCTHFFCAGCLATLMDEEAKKAQEVRKAKSNAGIKMTMACPECRHEYNRRNIVEDPVVRQLARLCMQLQLQPDVKELLSTDDSIFDLSQASPLTSPMRKRPAPAPSGPDVLAAAHTASSAVHTRTTPVRRKLIGAPAPTELPPAIAAAAAASPHPAPLAPPHIPPHDPFDFDSHDLRAPRAKVSKLDAASSPATAASRASSSSPTPTPAAHARSGRLPPRQATIMRRSYKEAETQLEESFTPEDADCDLNGAHDTPDTPHQRRRAHAPDSDSDAPLITYSLGGVVPPSPSSVSPPASAYKKTYPPVAIPPDACEVCGEDTEEEAVVTCRLCKVRVHSQLCYGPVGRVMTDADRAEWYCDRCSPTKGTKDVSCCVCPNTEDRAFKKTDKGQWIHASCAQWLAAPRWANPARRNMVCDVKKIPRESWSVPCRFCTGKGAILQCSYGHDGPAKCTFGYHVPCGVRFGIQFELRGPDESSQLSEECDDVFFHSFCKKHQPLAHLVPSCNSAVAESARKQKRKKAAADKKPKRAKTKATRAVRDEPEGMEEGDEDASQTNTKRAKRSDTAVNRTINLADTSLDTSADTSMNGGGVSDTPSKPSADALFRSLFHAPSTSPFTTPLQAAAAATPSPVATPTNSGSAMRKLAFTPPSCITTSVGVGVRASPGRSAVPSSSSMLRSASAGAMSTSTATIKPTLSRPSSMRHSSPAAAATNTATAAAASPSVANTPATRNGRAPLRPMARDEVHSRDAQRRNSASPAGAAGMSKSRGLARRRMVLLGTKLDADQQALLEELAAVLNQRATKEEKRLAGDSAPVTVQHHFDASVTHVVTSTTRDAGYILQGRTMKYFQGLLSGAWVLGVDWVSESLLMSRAVGEAEFLVRGDAKLNDGEVTHGAKRARNRDRLFDGMHFVWTAAAASKQATKNDVVQLVRLGGGVMEDALPASGGRRAAAESAHDSDMDEGESQMEDTASSAASPARARPTAPAPMPAGRWCLLVDDTGLKRRSGSSRLAALQSLVSPADWNYCVRQHVDIVGVTWLFDSISAFKLLHTERPTHR